jgi:hypothetical protein
MEERDWFMLMVGNRRGRGSGGLRLRVRNIGVILLRDKKGG